MKNHTGRLIAFVLSECFAVCLMAVAQDRTAKINPILSTKIEHFALTDQPFPDGVAKLSLETVPLALGFEEILREKFTDSPQRGPRFTLTMENKTVREILDALCRMDERYTWSLNGRTIKVYPRSTIGDSSYLLNRRLEKLEISSVDAPEHALKAIADQLPPPREQIAYAAIGGGDTRYAQPWTRTFEKLTVREAINELAAHMGTRSTWVFSGSKDFRAFSFFRTGFNVSATPEATASHAP